MDLESDSLDRIRQVIRDRLKDMKISAREASRRAGFNVGYVGDFLDGRSKAPEASRILKLAEALEVPTVEMFGEVDSHRPAQVKPVGDRANLIPLYRGRIDMSRGWGDVPLTASAYVPVLPTLAHVAEAYAVMVFNDFNAPRYFVGETVYVDPEAQVRPGDFVFVRLNTTGESGIDRLESIGDGKVTCQYMSPAAGQSASMSFDSQDAEFIHRIVGSVG